MGWKLSNRRQNNMESKFGGSKNVKINELVKIEDNLKPQCARFWYIGVNVKQMNCLKLDIARLD